MLIIEYLNVFRTIAVMTTLSMFNMSHAVNSNSKLTTFAAIPNLSYQIIAQYPHDSRAFTQGLLISQGILYESTGLLKHSSLRRINIRDGRVMQIKRLADPFFAEGLSVLDGKLYQLTWKAGEAYVYDQYSFQLLKTFQYKGEGWGLTSDGKQLIMSDGSHKLSYREPKTFQVWRQVTVHYQNQIIPYLNELEYVQEFIYANVWQQPFILKIQADSGEVVGKIDLSSIVMALPNNNPDAVLNGIAYWPERNSFLVTGKLWPVLFELVL